MRVSTPVPKNWKDIAISEGYTEGTFEDFYNNNYVSVRQTYMEHSVSEKNLLYSLIL